MGRAPYFLLINPWVTDFAAFDLWAKPLGLLQLGALLRDGGAGVGLVDCLSRSPMATDTQADLVPGKPHAFGTGGFPRVLIPKPGPVSMLPRRYYRYGISPKQFRQAVNELPRPDCIWVTSIMTYWYPGVQLAIALLREIHPDVPVWLGGIYAALCPEHASRTSGADEIVTQPVRQLPDKIRALTGFELRNVPAWERFEAAPSPALDLVRPLRYAPLLTSQGCPYRCGYCASHALQPDRSRKSADVIYREVERWQESDGVRDFAFYDDALLLDADATLKPALERIVRSRPSVRFHTPNALHVRGLTAEWCDLLQASGFTSLRLGLETTNPHHQREWGGKVQTEMFLAAVRRLHRAGFEPSRIGVYLLCGLPGQSTGEVREAIRIVTEAGAQPYLCEYSPIPGTGLWHDASRASPFDLSGEPLTHNNTFFACRRPDFTYRDLLTLKEEAHRARESTRARGPIAPDPH
ncbi:MAG: radical SAM protein [Syntrophobacteraceae bacterium]